MFLEDVSCGSCGQDMRLSTDPKLMHLWQADDDTVCWSCAVREVLQRIERAKHKDEDQDSKLPHYSEGRIFLASLLSDLPPPTALEVTG